MEAGLLTQGNVILNGGPKEEDVCVWGMRRGYQRGGVGAVAGWVEVLPSMHEA